MSWLEPGVYRHFKGNLYEVLHVAKHSETLEEMVVYRRLLSSGEVWVRPARMFLEIVADEQTGEPVSRFTFVPEWVKR